MRNTTILLVIVFLSLYFGYPKYQEYQMVNNIREEMRNEQVDVSELQGLPLKAEFKNEYPRISMIFRLTELSYTDLTPAMKKQMRKEVKAIACRNLEGLKGRERFYIKAQLKVFEEDRNSVYIIVKDKNDGYVTDHNQVISECRNFDDLRRSIV